MDDKDLDSESKGVGRKGLGKQDNPVQDDDDDNNNNSRVHKVEEEDDAEEDDVSVEDNKATVETVDHEEKDDESRVDKVPQREPEEAISMVPLQTQAVQELDCVLNGKHWETVWLDLWSTNVALDQ